MTGKYPQLSRRSLLVALAPLCLAPLVFHQLHAREGGEFLPLPERANVFVHPEKLTPKDKLTDGGGFKAIEITSETTLLWVDLAPDARYSHPTEYILISAEGTRVVKGGWWPVLNGKALFRDGKPKVKFPVGRLEVKILESAYSGEVLLAGARRISLSLRLDLDNEGSGSGTLKLDPNTHFPVGGSTAMAIREIPVKLQAVKDEGQAAKGRRLFELKEVGPDGNVKEGGERWFLVRPAERRGAWWLILADRDGKFQDLLVLD